MASVGIDRHRRLHDVFKALDADGSGEVDELEVMPHAIPTAGLSLLPPVLCSHRCSAATANCSAAAADLTLCWTTVLNPAQFMSLFTRAEEKQAKQRMAEIDNVRGRDGQGDGTLSALEFCEFFIEYMAHLSDHQFKERVAAWQENLQGSHRKLLLRRAFKLMDADNSGSVSLVEFKSLNDEVGTASSAALFKVIEGNEGNGDGELTSDEWVPFVLEQQAEASDEEFHELVDGWLDVLSKKRRETLLRAAFLKMDVDGSGSVDFEEVRRRPLPAHPRPATLRMDALSAR